MPNIVYGDHTKQSTTNFKEVDYHYDYPEGLELKPGSKLHDEIVDKVMERARDSASIMSARHSSWNTIDEVLTTYVDLTDEEETLQSNDGSKPVSIVFPYSYAILETLIGYLMAAFVQDPIFRYEGSGPEDTIGAILFEKVIQQQMIKSKVGLRLHTLFRDSMAYGFGSAVPTWRRDTSNKRVVKPKGFVSRLLGSFVPTGTETATEEKVLYEGNGLINVSAYQALPDTNVPIDQVQEGEFYGWLEQNNLMNLLSEEQGDQDMFNVKYLKHIKNRKSSVMNDDPSNREKKTGSIKRESKSAVTNRVDRINMYVKLIPEEWGLGPGQYPEKWYFQVGSDEILLRAQPLGLDHGLFPVVVAAPDFDGYSTTPVSRLETLYGLQHTLDFLFNMHIANVRKAINDMFVVDPYSININDIKNPKPGKLIRTRRPVWGKGVSDSIMQLGVNDVTRGNIADSSYIVQWMQKIGGADDAAMGSLRQGGPERLTGMEFQGTRQGAFNRLERVAKVIGLQAMQDLGYLFASHTQQLMTESTWVKATGEWGDTLKKEYGQDHIKVSPQDVLIDYDLIVRDGTVPGGNYSSVWEKMFEVIAKQPELHQEFDLVRIAKHIFRNNGAKNVEEFVRSKVKVGEDSQVRDQVQKGNMVPVEEYMGMGGQGA